MLNKEKETILKYLNKHRIFPSTLWPVPNEVEKIYSSPKKINSKILSFPIDHRYNKKDIEFITSMINKAHNL